MLTQSQSDVACEIRANSFGASLLSRSGPLSPVVLGLYHFMTAPSSLALTSRKPKGDLLSVGPLTNPLLLFSLAAVAAAAASLSRVS